MAKEYKKKLTPKTMWERWEEFKAYCDSKTVVRTEFSQKTGEFITAVIPAPITYTIKGYCVFIGMTEANFYATYDKNEKFELVIARMKAECEVDAREKFENNTLNSRLAGLWMSHYGYTTKTEANVDADVGVTIIDDIGE